MKHTFILSIIFLFSCSRSSTTTPHGTNNPTSSTPITPPVAVIPSIVRAEDIELICTPGSIPLNLIDERDDTLLYLRRKLISKVFSTPAGQDAIFKLELPFLNSASNKKVFFINQSNKDFCKKTGSHDVVGDIAKREAFIKAVKKQILWVEFQQK